MKIESSAFADGQPIPKQYTGEGRDVSPPLSFSGVPEDTAELALICDDPDALVPNPWVHWVICKIPSETSDLPEGCRERVSYPVQPGRGKARIPGTVITLVTGDQYRLPAMAYTVITSSCMLLTQP